MPRKVLHLYAPWGFSYNGLNRCRVYMPPGKNITLHICDAFRRWWDREDQCQNQYDQDLHDAVIPGYSKIWGEMLVHGSESFGVKDFAAMLEDCLDDYRIECFDRRPYPYE